MHPMIESELRAAMSGEIPMSLTDPRLESLLAEMRDMAQSPAAYERLGNLALSLLSARMKSGFVTERALGLMAADGSGGA